MKKKKNKKKRTTRKLNKYFYDQLSKNIKKGERKAKKEICGNGITREFKTKEDKEEFIQRYRDKATREFVLAFREAYLEFDQYIQEIYSDVVFNSKLKFPIGWMLKNKMIKEKIEKYPPLTPILNYIHERNRRGNRESELNKGSRYLKKIHWNKILPKGILPEKGIYKKGRKKYPLSFFITGKDFYEDMSKELKKTTGKPRGYSIKNIEKYMGYLNNNLYVRLGSTYEDKNLYIYSDGYFQQLANGRFKKQSWIKETKEIKEALRNFKP